MTISEENSNLKLDILTIIAISIIVYVLQNVLYELIGRDPALAAASY